MTGRRAAPPVEDAVAALVGAGIPAAALVHPAAIDTTEQHEARRASSRGSTTPSPAIVDSPLSLSVSPARGRARHRATRGWLRTPAPTLGQHTDEVLRSRFLDSVTTSSPVCGPRASPATGRPACDPPPPPTPLVPGTPLCR